jgi:hypothetical protein
MRIFDPALHGTTVQGVRLGAGQRRRLGQNYISIVYWVGGLDLAIIHMDQLIPPIWAVKPGRRIGARAAIQASYLVGSSMFMKPPGRECAQVEQNEPSGPCGYKGPDANG